MKAACGADRCHGLEVGGMTESVEGREGVKMKTAARRRCGDEAARVSACARARAPQQDPSRLPHPPDGGPDKRSMFIQSTGRSSAGQQASRGRRSESNESERGGPQSAGRPARLRLPPPDAKLIRTLRRNTSGKHRTLSPDRKQPSELGVREAASVRSPACEFIQFSARRK